MANRKRRSAAELDGQSDGHKLGWSHGYHLASCESIVNKISRFQSLYWNIKVLYVQEGLFNLNKGIIDSIGGNVRELVIAKPTENLVDLALLHRPDLVLVLNGLHELDIMQIPALRAHGFRTAVWFADDPYFLDKTTAYAPHYDHVFTHELGCVSYYQEHGCNQVAYLPLAVNPYQFCPMRVDLSYRSDICFVGTGFPNRIRFFNQVSHYLQGKKLLILGGDWESLHDFKKLSNQIRLEGTMESWKFYNGARIVINLHRSETELLNSQGKAALSINPRTYEISACGTMQLTDVRQDLTDFYQPGVDLVTYNTPEEMIDKLEYYLVHEAEREQIALQGLRTTMQKHTFTKRLPLLLQCIFGAGEQIGGRETL